MFTDKNTFKDYIRESYEVFSKAWTFFYHLDDEILHKYEVFSLGDEGKYNEVFLNFLLFLESENAKKGNKKNRYVSWQNSLYGKLLDKDIKNNRLDKIIDGKKTAIFAEFLSFIPKIFELVCCFDNELRRYGIAESNYSERMIQFYESFGKEYIRMYNADEFLCKEFIESLKKYQHENVSDCISAKEQQEKMKDQDYFNEATIRTFIFLSVFKNLTLPFEIKEDTNEIKNYFNVKQDVELSSISRYFGGCLADFIVGNRMEYRNSKVNNFVAQFNIKKESEYYFFKEDIYKFQNKEFLDCIKLFKNIDIKTQEEQKTHLSLTYYNILLNLVRFNGFINEKERYKCVVQVGISYLDPLYREIEEFHPFPYRKLLEEDGYVPGFNVAMVENIDKSVEFLDENEEKDIFKSFKQTLKEDINSLVVKLASCIQNEENDVISIYYNVKTNMPYCSDVINTDVKVGQYRIDCIPESLKNALNYDKKTNNKYRVTEKIYKAFVNTLNEFCEFQNLNIYDSKWTIEKYYREKILRTYNHFILNNFNFDVSFLEKEFKLKELSFDSRDMIKNLIRDAKKGLVNNEIKHETLTKIVEKLGTNEINNNIYRAFDFYKKSLDSERIKLFSSVLRINLFEYIVSLIPKKKYEFKTKLFLETVFNATFYNIDSFDKYIKEKGFEKNYSNITRTEASLFCIDIDKATLNKNNQTHLSSDFVHLVKTIGKEYFSFIDVTSNGLISRRHELEEKAEDNIELKLNGRHKPLPEREITINPDRTIGKLYKELMEKENEKNKQKTLEGCIRDEAALEEAIKNLNSLIGLSKVKKEITRKANVIKGLQKRKMNGAKINYSPSISMVFTGNPGTGKTTVGKLVAEIFYQLGYLQNNVFKRVVRADLVAEHIGGTEAKTTEILNECRGGILFIDEVYQFNSDSSKDFGRRAIERIMDAMEEERDNFTVIIAGYEKDVDKFLEINPGLKSRFKTYIEFEDYSNEECYQIFEKEIKKQENIEIKPEAKNIFLEKVEAMRNKQGKNFGNARVSRNMAEEVYDNYLARISAVDSGTYFIEKDDVVITNI